MKEKRRENKANEVWVEARETGVCFYSFASSLCWKLYMDYGFIQTIKAGKPLYKEPLGEIPGFKKA